MNLVQNSAAEFPVQERGYNKTDYRVFNKDMRIVLTTQDEAKAKRIAEKIEGTIHASR